MKYALGNMLNGAGGLNPDQLALDLQFSADKTLTARKGPTPVLTRASTGTFVGSNGLIQTAAINAARFDHDPVTLASRGLLIEESRTNFVRQSGQLSTSPWAAGSGATLTSGFSAPDSSTGGVEVSGVSGSRTTQGSLSLTSGQVYTLSVFLKQGTASLGRVSFFDGANFFVSTFTWSTLIASGTGGGSLNYTSTTTNFGNGWYRVTFTFTSTATTSNADGSIGLNSTGTIFIWGSQLELGSVPTSYIPTTTASVVRSADVCTIANTSPFWNSSEVTRFTNANFVVSGVDAYASNFSITSGFFGARRTIGNTAQGIIRSSGVSTDINFGSFTTGSMRMALAHSTGQQAGSLNGATVIQQNSAFVPPSNPPFNIGYSGAGAYINGYIVAIRYYRKRLANSKLVSLTT